MAQPPVVQTVTYATDANGTQRRLTVGRVTPMDSFRYNVYIREAGDWLEAQGYSRGWGDAQGEALEIGQLRLHASFRAQALAALKGIAESVDGGDTWQEAERPEAWATLDGFLGDVPLVVLVEWVRAAQVTNPGLWISVLDDSEKNADTVSDAT